MVGLSKQKNIKTVIIKDSKKNPNKYTDMMGVPIKKPEPK